MKLILTCEHGGNFIPEPYPFLFNGNEHILNSHRGYDTGVLDLFHSLKSMADYSIFSETSRLLIELNRSLHHPKLFSEFTKTLSKLEKKKLITAHYLPYRNAVERTIKKWIVQQKSVLHISVHSFTPVFNHKKRHADIGLLYDSKKQNENMFCTLLKKEILIHNPKLKIRYNYPYLGKADGFTTYLRKQFDKNYLGIELEVNQKHAKQNMFSEDLKIILGSALDSVLSRHY